MHLTFFAPVETLPLSQLLHTEAHVTLEYEPATQPVWLLRPFVTRCPVSAHLHARFTLESLEYLPDSLQGTGGRDAAERGGTGRDGAALRISRSSFLAIAERASGARRTCVPCIIII